MTKLPVFAALLVLTTAGLAACEDDTAPCAADGCCGDASDCCDGGDCCFDGECEPLAQGAAIAWESLAAEKGPAPSGTLFLKLTSGTGMCSAPWVSDLACEDGAWEADIPLPTSAQYVGAKVALADLEALGGAVVRTPSSAEPSCSFESQPLEGTLEVVAINENRVEVRVSGADPAIPDLASGVSATRCQNPDLPQQAVAMFQSVFDGLYAEKIGAPEDEPVPPQEVLHVFIDRSDPIVGAKCSDPLATLGGCDPARSTLQVTFDLDAQYTGTFEVGASSVTVTERTSATIEGVCEGSQATWETGAVVVLAITPSLLHLRLTDAEGAVVDAYATHCY